MGKDPRDEVNMEMRAMVKLISIFVRQENTSEDVGHQAYLAGGAESSVALDTPLEQGEEMNAGKLKGLKL